MLGMLLKILTGWELWQCTVLGAVLSLAYIVSGGFRADVYTNTAQFVLMYLGFAILLFFSIHAFGSPLSTWDMLPAGHKTLMGGKSWQYIFAWFVLAFQTFVDPGFHQRCSAARTPSVARRGILISILFWALFDMLTIGTGLYARAHCAAISDPLMAYPALAETVLPSVWKGIFIVAMLATVMSTLDSYAFLSGVTIGNDILSPIVKKFGRGGYSVKALTRAGLIFSAVISVYFAVKIPSAIELLYKAASVAVPGLLVPLVISYGRGFIVGGARMICIMILSAVTSILWIIATSAGGGIFGMKFSAFEPMMPGIILSVILALALVRRGPTYQAEQRNAG
jgi:SSS family solute:Na+ symporter